MKRKTAKVLNILALWLGLAGSLCLTGLASAQNPFGQDEQRSSSVLEQGSDRFLQVDEAFTYYASLDASDRITIHWRAAAGYYLYRDQFSFSLLRPGNEPAPLTAELPDGIEKRDEFFGDVEVYYGSVSATVKLPVMDDGEQSAATLAIEYQGCAEAGLCYPLQERRIDLSL